MREHDRQRVLDLMCRLERLETSEPTGEEEAVHQAAQQVLVAEISRLVRNGWLAVYRKGGSFDVVSLA